MDQGLSFPPLLTGASRVLWSLTGANMNTTADQALSKTFSFTNYAISQILVTNASTSLTLAAGGFYTGAGKTGITIVAAGQLYSGLTSSTLIINPTMALNAVQSATTLFLALTTGQGGAATADIYVVGVALT